MPLREEISRREDETGRDYFAGRERTWLIERISGWTEAATFTDSRRAHLDF